MTETKPAALVDKTLVAISDISIGHRYRAPEAPDDKDFRQLVDSINDIGLLQPVVLSLDYTLVAGLRRIRAAETLGFDMIEATFATDANDLASKLRAELDENTCRKPFKPTEAAALRKAIRAAMPPPNKGGRPKADKQTGGNLPPVSEQPKPKRQRKSRDVAADGTGYSGRTLDKVDEVSEIADDPMQPDAVREVAEQALEQIDDSGNVDASYQAVKAKEAEVNSPEPPAPASEPTLKDLVNGIVRDINSTTADVRKYAKACADLRGNASFGGMQLAAIQGAASGLGVALGDLRQQIA